MGLKVINSADQLSTGSLSGRTEGSSLENDLPEKQWECFFVVVIRHPV